MPGGWNGLVYFRLHGSPHVYWSSYDAPRLQAIAAAIRGQPVATEVWCVFDNTANGAAMRNACELEALLARSLVEPLAGDHFLSYHG